MVVLLSVAMAACRQQQELGPFVQGRVSNGRTGFGIAGVDLDVFDSDGNAVTIAGGPSGEMGRYKIALPEPGVYIVRADATTAYGFVDQYYDGVFLRTEAKPIEVAEGAVLTGIDFTLFTGASIEGTIRESASGRSLADIDIDLFNEDGVFLDSCPASTREDGTYTIGALPPGHYYLRADPSAAKNQFFLPTYYGNSPDLQGATVVRVGERIVSGIDIALPGAGSIAGRISDALAGKALADIDLDLFDSLGARTSASASTNANGEYEIGPVAAGRYLLRADPMLSQGYPVTYFPSAMRDTEAVAISVTEGARTGHIDFFLQEGGAVAGRIIDAATRQPLSGIDLDVYDAQNNRAAVDAATDENGRYAVGILLPGAYSLRADPAMEQHYPRTYYPNAYRSEEAVAVLVEAGHMKDHIDFALPLSGTISGTVSATDLPAPITGVHVHCYDLAGNRMDVNAKSGTDGRFRIGALAPGAYRLGAFPATGQDYGFQYYDGEIVLSAADPIVVGPAVDTSGVNFSLSVAGWIEGWVHSATGEALTSIDLDLFEAISGDKLPPNAKSGPDGRYRFEGLPPGAYKIRCDPSKALGLADLYFNARPARADAETVAVVAGAGVSNVNFILEAESSISGRVTFGGEGIGGLDMDVFDADSFSKLDQTASTGTAGNYSINSLPAGRYLLRADPSAGRPYRRTYFGGVPLMSQASPIAVGVGAHPADMDIALLAQ